MNPYKALTLLVFTFFCSYTALAQHTVEGKIIDSRTNEPLAFVNIIINGDPQAGTVSDIKGRFIYTSLMEIKSLTCSYVGYEKKIIHIDSLSAQKMLVIHLKESVYEFKEVVVKAGENPANRIIRKVIENKKVNNPEKISSFQYTSYNKVIYDFDFSDTTVTDDRQRMMDSLFQGGHVMVMESVTERKFIQPDNSEEVILGVKVSGFNSASFAPLATDLQPFSFYSDYISIFDINYLNPISAGSLNKYDFTIEDTLYYGVDTTFILSYTPLPGKNFDALTGLLYVNTNTYAIQNVIAEPFEKGFIDLKIQQKYRYLDNKQWFPEQLKFEMFIRQTASMTVGVLASGVSEIKDVELYVPLDKKDFSIEALRMDELANDRDSVFWQQQRPDPLSDKERKTYEVMDSIGGKYKFDALMKIFEKVALNKIPISFIDIDIAKLFAYNKYEGIRLGLGAYTNEKLMKHLSVGGFFGYGFRDAGWKYGGEVIATLDKAREFEVRVGYQNNLIETGKSRLSYFAIPHFDWGNFLAERMDQIKQESFGVGFRAFRYARMNIAFNHTNVYPKYTYELQAGADAPVTNYINSDFTLHLRYAFKEKIITSIGQRIGMGTKYPILSIAYSVGVKDVWDSYYSYNKIEARIEKSFYIKNLGESKFRVEGGYIDEAIPYGLLYTSGGSYVRNWSILVKNSFQTATPYEFLADRYAVLHYSHNFGSLLLQVGKWKPNFTVYQNIGWGSLQHPEYHRFVEFKTMEKGFYESGLQIDRIIQFSYFNVAYMGVGMGAYYRYGPYAYSSASDNLAFTLSVTFASK